MKLRAFAVRKVDTALLLCDGYGLVGLQEGRKSSVPGLDPLGRVQRSRCIIFRIVISSCSWPGSFLNIGNIVLVRFCGTRIKDHK